jgi:hypothetical protein
VAGFEAPERPKYNNSTRNLERERKRRRDPSILRIVSRSPKAEARAEENPHLREYIAEIRDAWEARVIRVILRDLRNRGWYGNMQRGSRLSGTSNFAMHERGAPDVCSPYRLLLSLPARKARRIGFLASTVTLGGDATG